MRASVVATDRTRPGHCCGMSPSTRGLPLLLALASACAQEPDALDDRAVDASTPADVSPSVEADADVVGRCRPGPARPTTAPVALPSPVTQTLPSPQRIGERPDLISGNVIRVDGALWISFGYRNTESEAITLRGHLLDEDNEVIELLPTDLASIPRSPEYGPGAVQLLLPATTQRARTQHVELRIEDRRGVGSAVLRMDINEAQTQPDGAPCTRNGIFNICREASACSPSGRCTPLTAPTLTSAVAFVASSPSGSALTLRWEDPNQDVAAIEVTARGRREALVIPVADPTRDGPWTQRWDSDVFEGATWLNVRVRDQSGRFSNTLNVAVSAPAPVAANDLCDPNGTVSRCVAGTVCTRDNGLSCAETRCTADVAACPSEVSTTTLDTAASTDGPWVTTGSMTGVSEVRASACDRYVGRALIHRFRAPAAGAYHFGLAAGNDTWTTRLIARTRCGMSDVAAQEASTSRGSRSVALTTTLTAGQELFLFVTTEDRFTLTATRVR